MRLVEFIADQLGYRKPEKDGEQSDVDVDLNKMSNRDKALTYDSKPSFKDAEEGIDVKDLRIAGKILEEFKKIMLKEVEIKNV